MMNHLFGSNIKQSIKLCTATDIIEFKKYYDYVCMRKKMKIKNNYLYLLNINNKILKFFVKENKRNFLNLFNYYHELFMIMIKKEMEMEYIVKYFFDNILMVDFHYYGLIERCITIDEKKTILFLKRNKIYKCLYLSYHHVYLNFNILKLTNIDFLLKLILKLHNTICPTSKSIFTCYPDLITKSNILNLLNCKTDFDFKLLKHKYCYCKEHVKYFDYDENQFQNCNTEYCEIYYNINKLITNAFIDGDINIIHYFYKNNWEFIYNDFILDLTIINKKCLKLYKTIFKE